MKEPTSTLRIGGVPEHFFYPWRKWFQENDTQKSAIDLTWKDYPGGSGAMIQALEKDELDLAFLLTEAVAFAELQGKTLFPQTVFVESPVEWGIFSGISNPLSTVRPVEDRTYAISRPGSGSQLMARVDAFRRSEVPIREDQWIVVQNLTGAEEALRTGKADLFFWEKWTTKPLVDQKIFKMVDVCPSPWPGFVLVAGKKLSGAQEERLHEVLNEVFKICLELKAGFSTASEIAQAYGQQEKDAASWLEEVRWTEKITDPGPAIEVALEWMKKVN